MIKSNHPGSHLLPIGDVYAQVDITKASRADLSDEAILPPDDELTAGGGGGGGHGRLFLVRHRARDQLELAELAGRSLCLLYSVSHKQLIQLARRGQPDQLGADLEASEEATQTLERRADGPTPDPGYHAPLKQQD